MKKIICVALCLAIFATMAISGTVAYLTDEEKDENVFKVGSVDIVQHEQQRGESGLVDFENPTDRIHPMVAANKEGVSENVEQPLDSDDTVKLRNHAYYANYVDKIVTVENKGASDAYVRNIVAIPTGLPAGAEDVEWLELDWFDMSNETSSTDWERTEIEEDVLIDGVLYDLYVFKYTANNEKLPYQDDGDDVTLPTLLGFGLSKHVNYDENATPPTYFYQEPGKERVDISFDPDNLKILVATQAVQTAGFADYNHAFKETFGEITSDNHPWEDLSSGYGYVGDQMYTWKQLVDQNLVTVSVINGSNSLRKIDPTLTELVINSNDVKSISTDAMNTDVKKACTLKKIVIGNGVETIYSNAFNNFSNLESVTFPSTPITVNYQAFANTAIKTISIPSNVYLSTTPTQGSSANAYGYHFSGCKQLESVVLENGIKVIPQGCFSNCSSLTSINLPGSITEIQQSVFYNCTSLPAITLPDALQKIGKKAFQDCDTMTSITIPSRVTEIGEAAFKYCDKLTTVTIENTEGSVTIGDGAFLVKNGNTSATVNYTKE